MPPALAALFCTLAIVGLLARDVRKSAGVSWAIWIPVIWMLIIGSRMPSEWLLGQGTVLANPTAYLDGSPLDRNVFLALMLIGIAILMTRSIRWGRFFVGNTAITIFFAFTLVSVLWSDYPLVAIKRWNKVVGHVVMAMVILTDPQPTKAFAAVIRRCAYVLLPLSVLFIKYYPELGRGFDIWTGAAVNPGVTTNKNALGNLCLVTVPLFVSAWLGARGSKAPGVRVDRIVDFVFIAVGGWLLIMADSSASLVSTVLAVGVVCALQVSVVRRQFTTLLLTCAIALALLLTSTNLMDSIILALGEDTTLTGRTDLWQDLQQIEVNPLIGVGFESFWVGERVAPLWEKYWWQPNQAHNGYYEMYLNLGILGLLAQAAMIMAGYRKARKDMLSGPAAEGKVGADGATIDETARAVRDQAYYRLAFLLGLLAFNLTDATFKAMHLSFFAFFVVALGYRRSELAIAPVAVTPPHTKPHLWQPRHASVARAQETSTPSKAVGVSSYSGSRGLPFSAGYWRTSSPPR
jgi:O-antigen ligase